MTHQEGQCRPSYFSLNQIIMNKRYQIRHTNETVDSSDNLQQAFRKAYRYRSAQVWDTVEQKYCYPAEIPKEELS